LFAALAAGLALMLRNNRAQTRYALWLAASVKFLVPFSLLFAIGARIELPGAAPIAHTAIPAAAHEVTQPFVALEPLASGVAAEHGFSLAGVLLVIWLVGFVAVVVSWVRRWVRVRRAMKSAWPVGPAVKGAYASGSVSATPQVRILATRSLLEPGIFGVFRPVLLLPEGITEHLTAAHLNAVIAHELCHARRRDNLAAVLHMMVEAIFWFHPLVWWIGARLIEERERACDEEVLRLGNQPSVYAESILKTCQFYLGSPLPSLSGVTGSDLKKRITQIMNASLTTNLSRRKKLLLASAAVAAVTVPLLAGLADTTPAPAFEIASIKPSKPGPPKPSPFLVGFQIGRGAHFTVHGITPKMLLEEAYSVKDAQISQAPPWFDTDRYDIDAKPEEPVGAAIDKLPPGDQKDKLMQMVQALLADRFKLAISHESKEMPVYAMVVAKGGPKMKVSDFKPPEHPEGLPPMPPKSGDRAMRGRVMLRPGKITSTGVEMRMLADVLSDFTGRPVIDKTNLSGRYEFTLQWTPDTNQMPMAGMGAPGGPGPGRSGGPEAAPAPESNGPSLFTAIREQLGLRLESQKAPMDVLVITHSEKPSEN
jgi:uncharacterized protein (TIGR03435 family)